MKRISVNIWCAALITIASIAGAAERETIAIIGTGDLGDSFGQRLAALGYPVVYGSRTPDSDRVKAVVEKTGHGAIATSQMEAAQQADIIFLPITWPAMETAAQSLGNLDGKIVVDPSIPWGQGEDGYPVNIASPSSAELIQQWNPGARVVKGLGTMSSTIIDDPESLGGIVTIPLASDDKDAKERVSRLVDELGFDPVDFGPLRMARNIESMQMIYMIPLLQIRTEEWEFYFRRNAHWVCQWGTDWSEPVFDAGNLAVMAEHQDPPDPCE